MVDKPKIDEEAPQIRIFGGFKKEEILGGIASNAYEAEDEFKGLYGAVGDTGVVIIQPTYNLKLLDSLSQQNNALSPCIEAMVTNIDGTGYTFERRDRDDDPDADSEENQKIVQLNNMFSITFPGESFTTLRRKKRRCEERVGNAYFEVLRNKAGEILFLRHVDPLMVRLVRLDDPVLAKKIVYRGDERLEVDVYVRERRFAQVVSGTKLVYFKEFGASRELHKDSGKWIKTEKSKTTQSVDVIPLGKEATELMHFTAIPDTHTPYGLPRWISQLPSVLGSRKAEEFNLEFFDSGGVPPAIIFLQGGTMTAKTRQAIDEGTMSNTMKKHRLLVIEMDPTGGSLDKSGSASAKVERFGSDRQSDSMFEKYDDKCEERIRKAFRLPPIFVGVASDYSFATAYASYSVAEAQVFKPEREEFDEIISINLLTTMGFPEYVLRSLPLSIENTEAQLAGIDKAKEIGGVPKSDLIRTINEVTGLSLKYNPEMEAEESAKYAELHPPPPMLEDSVGSNVIPLKPAGSEGQKNGLGANGVPSKKTDYGVTYQSTADLAFRIRDALFENDKQDIRKWTAMAETLAPDQLVELREFLSKMVFINSDHDLDGLSSLTGCAALILAREE